MASRSTVPFPRSLAVTPDTTLCCSVEAITHCWDPESDIGTRCIEFSDTWGHITFSFTETESLHPNGDPPCDHELALATAYFPSLILPYQECSEIQLNCPVHWCFTLEYFWVVLLGDLLVSASGWSSWAVLLRVVFHSVGRSFGLPVVLASGSWTTTDVLVHRWRATFIFLGGMPKCVVAGPYGKYLIGFF